MPSKIEWTQETWNPVIGCTKISAGCQNCYAERMAGRLWHMEKDCGGPYKDLGCYNGKWSGRVITIPEAFNKPLRWKKPRDIFVCSMSDLFHEKVEFNFIYKVFEVMLLTPQHRYFVLTKRSERMKNIMPKIWFRLGCNYPDKALPLKNVIGMVTVENQEMADKRIPDLLASSFCLRGISAEPLLSAIDLNVSYGQGVGELALESGKLNWCVVGAESGHNARLMRPEWAFDIARQCKDAGVPYFVKQIHLPKYKHKTIQSGDGQTSSINIDGFRLSKNMSEWPEILQVRELPWGNDGN